MENPEIGKDWLRASDGQRLIVEQLLEKRLNVGKVTIYIPEEASTTAKNDRTHMLQQLHSLFREPESLAWEFIGYHAQWLFFEIGDFRFQCQEIWHGTKASKDSTVANLRIVGANMRQASRRPFLYIGNAKVDAAILQTERSGSTVRLSEQNLNVNEIGLKYIQGSLGRKGKQPEQLVQPEQAINNDRRKSRKGKQPHQQRPM
ncbi:hypothetical protein ACQY0O_004144 [Thecaphora frezii]